jgi:septal ring-binding cell division protein DamX
MENSGDLEMDSDNLHHEEGDLKLSASRTTKYNIINKSENSSVPKASLSEMDEKELLSTTPISVLLSEHSGQSLTEPIKAPDSAMRLVEDVGNMSTEDGRAKTISQRNASADKRARKEATTETVTIITEPFAVNAAGTKHSKNRDFQLKRVLLLLVIIWRLVL